MNTDTFLNIVNINLMEVHAIISHRINEEHHEYLFKIIFSQEQKNLNIVDEHIENKEHIEDAVHYHIWLKDTFRINDILWAFTYYNDRFHLETTSSTAENRKNEIIKKIYDYCSVQDIKILYCAINRDHEYDEVKKKFFEINDERQTESLKYFMKIYPCHKVIREYGKFRFYNILPATMKVMKRGDIFYTFDLEKQIIRSNDITLFRRRIENIPMGPILFFDCLDRRLRIENYMTGQVMYVNNDILNIDEVIERTKEYISIIDFNLYKKKISTETIVSVTNERIGRDSSVKVLPKHLLRQICLWLY
jgi:hypothetical protein